MNVKKTKVMVFNFANPCQEFMFEGDIIKRVQTFKCLGILLETTSNLDSVVEHLATTSRLSLFALNLRCAKLHIMDLSYVVTSSTRRCVSQAMPMKFGWTLRK
jgi:hypothetical protein